MNATATVTWDGLDAAGVAERFGLTHVELHSEINSTLDRAHVLAENGAPAGTIIVADAQRAGRGRLGRSWSSEPGRGVWCTILERPNDARALNVLSIRVGLGIADELEELTRARLRLKWPNDLMLGERKLGGILVETRWSGSALAWVAIGVGVNTVPPSEIETAAGLPEGVRRMDVLQAIVRATRSAVSRKGELSEEELERYRVRDMLVGRRVVSPAVGRVVGIDASGSLIVATPAGGMDRHRTGTVRYGEES